MSWMSCRSRTRRLTSFAAEIRRGGIEQLIASLNDSRTPSDREL